MAVFGDMVFRPGRDDATKKTMEYRPERDGSIKIQQFAQATGSKSGGAQATTTQSGGGPAMANAVLDAISKMQQNSKDWHNSDAASQKSLFDQNQALGTSIGAKYDSNAGTWDYSGVRMPEEPKQSGVGIPAFTPGPTVSTKPLKDAIGNKPTQNFDMSQLKQYTDAAARYQSPEGIQQLISQMVTKMQPLTDLQKQSAQSGFNQGQQATDSKWASRGLLASGAAAAQQQQGVNNLAGQMATIQANAQTNAIPLAFNAANLGLQENAQKFGQLAQALGMQEDQLQNYLRNMTNMTNIDIGQNQWSNEFGLKQQAQNYDMAMGNAKFDQSVKDSDRNFGLQEGQLTGNYIPQELKGLYQQIIGAKQNYGGEGTPQSIAAQAQANTARDKMAQMGIDANKLFGADVTLDQALKNFGGLGKSTMDKQRLDQQGNQWQDEYELTKDKWEWERDTKFPWEQKTWESEFNWQKEYQGGQLGVSQARQKLEEQMKGADDKTQGAIADIMMFYSSNANDPTIKQKAQEFITTQTEEWKKAGVDMEKIQKSFQSLFPQDKSNADDPGSFLKE